MTDDPAILLVKSLGGEPFTPNWPVGARIAAFDEERHPRSCHALLEGAYAQGQGEVPPFEAWWQILRSDGECDAELVFVVLDDSGEPIGFAQCWTSAFIKDFAIASDWRRRGTGTALLAHVFEIFRRGGFDTLRLKVRADNHPAIAFYEAMRMERES